MKQKVLFKIVSLMLCFVCIFVLASCDTKTDNNINTPGTSDVTYINPYTVELSKNIDKAGTISSAGTYKYGKEITIKAETNAGYTFNGWYNGNNLLTDKLSYTFTMPANNLTYEARWTLNTDTPYKVMHYLQNIDNDNYTLYETDSLTGTTDTKTNGEVNTYKGFEIPTITQVNIDGDGQTAIELYYIRNSYTVELSKNIDKAGTIFGAGSYKYGKEITIKAKTNVGYTFDGWYNGNNLLTDKLSYTFTMPAENIVYTARYTVNKYTITINNQVEGVTISGVTSGNQYEYDTQIELTATNIPLISTIKWTRSDGVIYSGENYIFKVPAGDITVTVTTIPYKREENKIYFGTYPQTKVTDTTLISELNAIAGQEPTSTNKYNWTDYNYYIGEKVTSFMFYQDIDYDNNGTYDYRGVYFTQYRPRSYFSNSSYTNQDDNGYSPNTIYWFSYDPIEWNILTESDGKALIIANLILDSQEYCPNYGEGSFNHNGGTGYANNYELSAIRKFLNDNFYNTAFKDSQKSLIETTTVDNSIESTGQNSNSYACNNTKDKIFLLSYKEASTYYINSTDRQAQGSDYANAQGLFVYDENGYWLLRSPYYGDDTRVYVIHCSGNILCNFAFYNNHGVRPVCWINLANIGI